MNVYGDLSDSERSSIERFLQDKLESESLQIVGILRRRTGIIEVHTCQMRSGNVRSGVFFDLRVDSGEYRIIARGEYEDMDFEDTHER